MTQTQNLLQWLHHLPLPTFSYPVEHKYPWKYFNLFVYIGSIIVLALLAVVSFATQGYETQTILSTTYNQTQFHWFNNFSPAPKAGTLCDPHVFAIGDSFQTTQGVFLWTLDYTVLPDPDDPSQNNNTLIQVNDRGVSYPGYPLGENDCDIAWMQVTADLATSTSSINAIIRCNLDGSFPISASTSFTASNIPGRATWNSNRYLIPGFTLPGASTNAVERFNFVTGSMLLQPAGLDLLLTMRKHVDAILPSNVVTLAATLPGFLDSAGYNPPPIDCTSNPLKPALSTLGFSNMTFTNNTAASQIFQTLFYNATANFMQAMLAAVRIDFGNKCPNYLTHPSLINETFLATPDLTPDQYTHYFQSDESIGTPFYDILHHDNIWLQDNLSGIQLPIYDVDLVYISAAYLCHITVRKGIAQLVVAIAGAMSSLFLSIWGIFMYFAQAFVAKRPKTDYCNGHWQSDVEEGSPIVSGPRSGLTVNKTE
ncbi:hypothetical protein FRB95_004895 [Tulasnella sp. JGI-2019a]|nr:hypothetical protein FRB95_004895 [Tulasnella sp. JGI-2019a]